MIFGICHTIPHVRRSYRYPKLRYNATFRLQFPFSQLALLNSIRCTLYLRKGVARISSMHSSLLFLPPFRSYCNKQFFSNYKNSPRVCDVCNRFLRCIYYSNTLRCCNLIFRTWLRNSFCNLTYSIRFVIRFCSDVSCAHYLVACFLTDAKYSILKDVKIERVCENGLVMNLSLYFLRFLRLFDELYRRLFTTFSSISVHTRNVIMYLFTEMSDGSPGRRTFDNPTRYRWLNRKWRTRVYGATKLLGTFATEREPAGMWECVPSLSVFKKSRWERHPRKRPRWFHESRFFPRLLFFSCFSFFASNYRNDGWKIKDFQAVVTQTYYASYCLSLLSSA